MQGSWKREHFRFRKKWSEQRIPEVRPHPDCFWLVEVSLWLVEVSLWLVEVSLWLVEVRLLA